MDTLKQLIIGIGNKARNGKDTFAKYLYDIDPNVFEVMHFADALKEECTNKERVNSLLILHDTKILLLNKDKESGLFYYDIRLHNELPELVQWMQNKEITSYEGMNEKDPVLLQLWGTQYRRKFNPDYWVNKLMENLPDKPIILIPDTRFKNELSAIRSRKGVFIKVERIQNNGSQYLDPERDPKHLSEIDLDDETPEVLIRCKDGDMIAMKNEAYNIAEALKVI